MSSSEAAPRDLTLLGTLSKPPILEPDKLKYEKTPCELRDYFLKTSCKWKLRSGGTNGELIGGAKREVDEIEKALRVLELSSGTLSEALTLEPDKLKSPEEVPTVLRGFLQQHYPPNEDEEDRGGVDESKEPRRTRMRVMHAIGHCKSLVTLDVADVHYWKSQRWRLFCNPCKLFFGANTLLGGWHLLVDFLCTNTTLKILDLVNTDLGLNSLALIAKALTANIQCPLTKLNMGCNSIRDEEGAKHVHDILEACPTLNDLGLQRIKMTEDGARKLGKAVMQHKMLDALTIGDDIVEGVEHTLSFFVAEAFNSLHSSKSVTNLTIWIHKDRLQAKVTVDELEKLLRVNTLLKCLGIFSLGYAEDAMDTLQFVPTCWKSFFDALKHHMSMKKLFLKGLHFEDEDDVYSLGSLIHANTPLEVLRFTFCTFSNTTHKGFFKSLRDNTQLMHLGLTGSRGLDNLGSVEDLMHAIHVNSSLKKIYLDGTQWGQDGRGAWVLEGLRQKSRQESYMQVLWKGLPDAQRKAPTTGRVFFCGQPKAGLPQLATTMLRVEKKIPIRQKILKILGYRTEGIEIQVLKDDENMQIVLWDLAGQDIFRALQEHLFPKINKACLYLFVYSPCDYDLKDKVCQRNDSIEDDFEKEFRLWLRFICTNSNITGGNLPHVVVVITHKDQLSINNLGLTNWVSPIIERIRTQFAGVIEISNDQEFCIDSRKKKEVQPILHHLHGYFNELFHHKLVMIPDTCCKVSKWIFDKRSKQSIMSMKEFFSLCKEVDDVLVNTDGDETLQAMTKYLHDVGTIIDLSHVDLIVVNPNWLTNVFLGGFYKP